MEDPEPAVVIVGFAEGAIDFEVRVFTGGIGTRALPGDPYPLRAN